MMKSVNRKITIIIVISVIAVSGISSTLLFINSEEIQDLIDFEITPYSTVQLIPKESDWITGIPVENHGWKNEELFDPVLNEDYVKLKIVDTIPYLYSMSYNFWFEEPSIDHGSNIFGGFVNSGSNATIQFDHVDDLKFTSRVGGKYTTGLAGDESIGYEITDIIHFTFYNNYNIIFDITIDKNQKILFHDVIMNSDPVEIGIISYREGLRIFTITIEYSRNAKYIEIDDLFNDDYDKIISFSDFTLGTYNINRFGFSVVALVGHVSLISPELLIR